MANFASFVTDWELVSKVEHRRSVFGIFVLSWRMVCWRGSVANFEGLRAKKESDIYASGVVI